MSQSQTVPLADDKVFQIVSGLWKGARQPLVSARVLRSTNFRLDGLLDVDDVAVLEVESRHLQNRFLKKGDILVERSGGGPKQPVGRVAYFDEAGDLPFATSNFTSAIRVVDVSKFNPEFVSLFLHWLYIARATEPLQRATTGLRNLDWGEYLKFEVPAWPMQVQDAVVSLASGLRRLYRIEDERLATHHAIKRVAMRELFTRGLRGEAQKETEIGPIPESWDLVPIESILRLTSGKTRPPALAPASSPSKPYPVLGGNGVMGYSDKWFLDVLPSLVIGRVGEYCGVVHVAREKCWITDNALYVREWLRPDVRVDFVAEFLRHFDLNRFKRVAGQPLVTQGMIYEHKVPVPAIEAEQLEIIAVLETIDSKIALHRESRAVLESLFKSILHKVMTGKIRAADLNTAALVIATETEAA